MDRKELVKLAQRLGLDAYRTAPPSPSIANFVRSTSVLHHTGSGLSRRTKAKEYIFRLERVLEESPHIPLTLPDVAHILSLETTYCCKVFQEITGKSFSGWMRRIRIRKAQTLLRLRTHSITDVSHAVGYEDITTFERNFRKELGLSPKSFLQLNSQPVA